MKSFTTALLSAAIVFAAGNAGAQDAMKKDDPMAKDAMSGKEMTMQQCKDHMAMAKKSDMKKNDAMMKKDTMCADMMKKDGMMKPGMAASEPMMKK